MSGPGAEYVRTCPVRTEPLSKMSTSDVFFLGFLTNLVQRDSSTLETYNQRIILALKD
jgi:hypothetical protein